MRPTRLARNLSFVMGLAMTAIGQSHAQRLDTSAAATAAIAAASSASAAASAARAASEAASSASAAASLLAAPATGASSASHASAPPTRPTGPVDTLPYVRPAPLWLYGLPLVALGGTLAVIFWIGYVLTKDSAWSLRLALSDESRLPLVRKTTDANGNVTEAPEYDKDGQPVLAVTLVPSTSRMIALVGMIVIAFLYLSFGTFALVSFGNSGRFPSNLGDAVTFLVSGLTLFAPYAINRLASAVPGSAGK